MAVNVGLFTRHDQSSTAAYLRAAIDNAGDRVTPLYGTDIATADLDALLFVEPPPDCWPVGLEDLRCPTAVYLIDTHQDLGLRLTYAPFFDEIFVAQLNNVADVRAAGYPQAQWLPLAADRAFAQEPSRPRHLDVAFVGKLGQSGTPRREVLDTIASSFRTNDLRRRYRPSEMRELYGQAKIVVNASIGGDVNMRVFEAMVSGALLVTDRIGNGLDELFTEGEHYVGYSTANEARDAIAHYLDDHCDRVRIAAAGQRQVLSQHTYDHRWLDVRARLTNAKSASRALADASAESRRKAYARVSARLGHPGQLWRATRPWTPRSDSASNLFYTAVALGRRTNRVVPFTPRAVRARAREWRSR
jgi:hypothetical protein